jgi:tetratricopeptide (TPR) repeat protein
VLDHAHALQLTSAPLSQLLSRTGHYLWGRGLNVRLARELHEQALAIRQQLYDGDHPDVAASLDDLAIDLHDLGEVGRARELHEQALAMVQRLYDGDHRSLVLSMNNLAMDLRALRDYGLARELDEQALAMLQRLHKEDHPDVALSMNNLAKDLRALGEYGRARELDEQASEMRERLDNVDRPSVIELLKRGRRASAAALLEKMKREDPSDAEVRNAYGFCLLPDHPEEGLQEIHAASELGHSPQLPLANRMFGLFLLHEYNAALEAADRLFREEDRHEEAYLWDWRKAPEDTSIISIEPRSYAVQFALDIARITEDTQAINVWARRAEGFESG